MNTKETKLSISGKITRQILIKTNGMEFKTQRILAACFFVFSALWVVLGLKNPGSHKLAIAVGWGFVSLLWFFKSGCAELLEKGYLKNNSNKSSEPT